MRRRLLPLLTAICCAVALSACGSSSSPGQLTISSSSPKPSSRGLGSGPTAARRKVAVAVTTCMRKRGMSAFPEPRLTPPRPTARIVLIARDQVYFAIPRDLQNVAGYEADAAACGLRTVQKGANATPFITSD